LAISIYLRRHLLLRDLGKAAGLHGSSLIVRFFLF
jgi:hypothetical protein